MHELQTADICGYKVKFLPNITSGFQSKPTTKRLYSNELPHLAAQGFKLLGNAIRIFLFTITDLEYQIYIHNPCCE